MKVGMIAPGMEKDGVKKYTDFLVDELREDVDVERIELFETVSLLESLKLASGASEYDLVHIQFTPEFWGDIFGYFWGSYLIPFLLLSRTKSLLTAHEYDFEHPNPVVHKLQELKFKLIYTLSDKVIVHNDRGKQYIKEFAPRADIEVIHHGLPDVDGSGEKLDIEGKVILIFGFIRRDKDYEEVFDALEELPDDYKLLVAGSARTEEDEGYEEELKREVSERGLDDRVSFYGYVPDEEIGKVFNSADVSLLPYESSSGSGVLALSLAHDVPVLMSDLPIAQEMELKTYSSQAELKEILAEGNFSEASYLEHIENLRKDRSWKTVAEKTVNLYQEIVG